jgi:nucleolar protein 56
MSEESPRSGWFEGVDRGGTTAASDAIRDGVADDPRDWPGRAVETGFATDEADYYDALHGATMAATRAAVAEAGSAGDRQLVHAVRAMDDHTRYLV